MIFKFKKFVSSILICGQFTLMFYNISAYAANNNATYQGLGAADAYSLQKELMNDMNHTTVIGNNMNFGNKKIQDSISRTGDGNSLNTNDLTPATSGKISQDKYYVNKKPTSVAEMQATYELPNEGISVLSQQKSEAMDKELENDAASIESQAYSTLIQVAGRSKTLDANDPIFKKSNTVISNVSGNPFDDCELDDQILAMQNTVHTNVPTLCSPAPINTGCTLTHNISLSVGAITDTSDPNIKVEGANVMAGTCAGNRENCVNYRFGDINLKADDPFTSGSCATGEISTTFSLINQNAIKRVMLKSLQFAGTVKVITLRTSNNTDNTTLYEINNGCAVNSQSQTVKVNASPADKNNNHGVDITHLFTNDAQIVTLKLVYTGHTPVANIEFEYNPKQIVSGDSWADDNCAYYARKISSGELTGTVSCNDFMTGELNLNRTDPDYKEKSPTQKYVIFEGYKVDKSLISSLAGLPSNCSNATVRLSNDNFITENSTDEEKEAIEKMESCKTLRDKGCGDAGTKCIKYDSKNNCILESSVYDCGYDSEVETSGTKKTYKCAGPISCQGIDCINIMVEDGSKDFAKALGLMQMTQQGTSDIKCTFNGGDFTNIDPNTPLEQQGKVECIMWAGENKECTINKFGWAKMDCCHEPGANADVKELVRQVTGAGLALSANFKATSGLMNYGHNQALWDGHEIFGNEEYNLNDYKAGGAVGGVVLQQGWDLFKNNTGLGQNYTKLVSKINRPVVSALNNISPYAGAIYEGLQAAAEDYVIQQVGNYVGTIICNAMVELGKAAIEAASSAIGSAIAESTSSAAAESGGSAAAGGAAGAILGAIVFWIGIAYMIYKIADIIFSMAVACDDPEEDAKLQNAVQLKKCDQVTSYCKKKNAASFHGCQKTAYTYCCFDSPLSRIINKQVRYAERGCPNHYPDEYPACAFTSFYSNKIPDCTGISLERLAAVDWEKIDLTEWLSLLDISGALPKFDVDGLTANEYLPYGGIDSNGVKHDNKQQSQINPDAGYMENGTYHSND